VIIGLTVINSQLFQSKTQQAESIANPPPTSPQERTVSIFPQIETPALHLVSPAPPKRPHFARTSSNQESDRPDKPAFIGERNTQATSDRKPDPSAPLLPSQKGMTPKDPDHYETTESDYKDGSLASNRSLAESHKSVTPKAKPASESSTQSENSTKRNNLGKPDPGRSKKDRLLEGPNPMDMAVTNEPHQPKQPVGHELDKTNPRAVTAVKHQPNPTVKDPAFSGFQRKTAIIGSINRNGQSAFAVEDTPLGHYQAIISRAVELEWQRNCVRHRDFITPGFLTARFFVDVNGHVRSVKFIGEMETGEIQKGFTLNSIRDADIPPMPPALKKELAKEPLELIFNFYF
jgi:hypothetical protein